MATWILTASPENHEATAAHGFEVIGFKEGKPGKADEYPWRFPTEQLAFQGQVRTISDADADVLLERMRSRAGTTVAP
jgi:hypothetical protein